MTKPMRTLFLLAAVLGPACSDSSPGDDVGDDVGDDIPPDGNAPPFTDGVSTLAGGAEAGYVDGARGTALFANPVNVAYGPDGKVYVADFDNGKIRVVDAETGETGTAIAIQGFERPFGMAFAADGTLYVSTDRNPDRQQSLMSGTIWRVDTGARTATPIAANIGRPRGLAVLPNGKIAAADYVHHVVLLVDPATGAVTSLAGTRDAKGNANGQGPAARFSTPYGLVYANGELIVADFDNHQLRAINPSDGTVTTFAGTGEAGFGDDACPNAKFNKPQGLAVDSSGTLYVSDIENYRVRRIRNDTVETIAGTGEAGFRDHDDPLQAQLFGLEGLSVTPSGSMVFVADGGRGENVPHNRVRSIKLN